MREKTYLKTMVIIISVVFFALIGTGFANNTVVAPTVTKSASPTDINVAGSGGNETTTVTLTVTGGGGEWTETVPMDVVFALDSSGSMTWNDPSNLRKTASKDFVDKMDSTRDQAGVVSWDENIDFTQGLTNNFGLVKSKIDAVDSSGGTNLNAGLSGAIGVLDAGKQADSVAVIIFLTDGQGTYTYYPGNPVGNAASKGYVIYSIGLGSASAAPLKDMANATGGKYYASPSAANLQAIFDDIYTEIINSTVPYNVDVVEVTKSYIVNENNITPAPDNVIQNFDGTTTIIWENIGVIADGDPDFSADETVTLSFTAECNQAGANLEVDVFGVAKVDYEDKDGNYVGSVDIPQAYINVNAPPDVSKAYPSIDCLWPPNHKFTDVTVEGVTDPEGDKVIIEIVDVTSDEPTNSIDGAGGKNAPDADGIGTSVASLRAERSGESNGRVYEVKFVASDEKGGEAEGSVFVNVPHDNDNGCQSVDDGQFYDATGIN